MVRGEALLFLRLLTVGVNSCTVGIGGDVQNGVEVKAAVQLFDFCLQRSSHGFVLRPAGCDNQAGHQTELGIDLADDFQASFLVGAAVYAADDVGLGNAAGFDALAGDLQCGCFLCGGGQQHDSHVAVIVVRCGIVHIGGERGSVVLHHQRGQQNVLFGIGRHAAGDGDGFLCVLRGVRRLVRVKHVHQDDGGVVINTEVGVHTLAKSEVLEVVRVAEGFLALCKTVTELRGVRCLVRVFCQVNGGRAENDLQASAGRGGGG